jgi:hypothetical protein
MPRRSLYKYYDEHRWAEAFLDGDLLFRSLSYFRDYEDENVRGDPGEGASIFRPEGGLAINNRTRGTSFVMPHHGFESKTKFEEIFIFCASKSHSDERNKRFSAVAFVEVLDIKSLCKRVESALPPEAKFRAKRVEYYRETENITPRWALPEMIATSKLSAYAWQDEYRLLFSLTGALEFENVDLRLVPEGAGGDQVRARHLEYPVKAGNLRDICCLHELQ